MFFGPRIELFKVMGVRIRIDLSWFILALLITWSLANLFPRMYPAEEYPAMTRTAYWSMGALGAIGLFISILLHELGHARAAQAMGVPMRGITLFIFGGVAEMESEPPSARAEFIIAVAGPIVSVVLSLVLFALAAVPMPLVISGVVLWLAIINLILVAFNILPAFPLDGGRVLRSILWHVKGNLRWATKITSRIGGGFGIAFVVLGALEAIVTQNLVGGLWLALVGLFLRNAAQMSYQQVLVRHALQGESITRFMRADVHTVPLDITVARLVEDFIYRQHHKMFPVVEDGQLVGCVSTRDVQGVPREQWQERTVRDITRECSSENTISQDTDVIDAISKMSRTGASRLMVVDSAGQLLGVLSLKDLLQFISLKVELEGEPGEMGRARQRPVSDAPRRGLDQPGRGEWGSHVDAMRNEESGPRSRVRDRESRPS